MVVRTLRTLRGLLTPTRFPAGRSGSCIVVCDIRRTAGATKADHLVEGLTAEFFYKKKDQTHSELSIAAGALPFLREDLDGAGGYAAGAAVPAASGRIFSLLGCGPEAPEFEVAGLLSFWATFRFRDDGVTVAVPVKLSEAAWLVGLVGEA